MELLNDMVYFQCFKGCSMLFSIVTALIYSPVSGVQTFPFSISLLILVIIWGHRGIFESGRHVYHSGSGDNTNYVLYNMLKAIQLYELIM